jgi:hypothetical protein
LKEAIGAAAPISVKLETPEDLEKAAETLRKEATRRREETLTLSHRISIGSLLTLIPQPYGFAFFRKKSNGKS